MPFVDYCRGARMDGAANWLLNAGANDFLCSGPATTLAALFEFADTAALKAFAAEMEGDPLCRPLIRFGSGRYCPVLIAKSRLDVLETKQAGALGIKRIQLGSPVALRALAEPEAIRQLLDMTPPRVVTPNEVQRETSFSDDTTVVMGVIDDGIGFAHDRFRDGAASSRVYAHWSMENFPGTELLKHEIEALFEACSRDGVVDEDAVYRESGIADYRRGGPKTVERRIAHGTHVCDLAAGEDWGTAARGRPIISVSLPADVLADTSGRFLDAHLAMAIGYILDRAEQLSKGKRVSVVITASIGTIAGPHDGSSLIEKMMDEFVSQDGRTVRIVLPAGNAHMSRCHAEVRFGSGAQAPDDGEESPEMDDDRATAGEEPLEWVLLPDDRTMSSMQVWLPPDKAASESLSLRLAAPSTEWVEVRVGDRAPGYIVVDGCKVAMVQWREDAARGRGVFELWTLPTARDEPTVHPVAPAGRWQLTFVAGEGTRGVAQAWIQRDDSLYGYPLRGRQSYFDHPRFEPFGPDGSLLVDDPDDPESPIKRRNLLNALASGSEVLVAGGYVRTTAEPARYSAGGDVGAGGDRKPDVLLPSERSPVARGIVAAGSRSGARVALGGTSVAAPLLARFVADRIDGDLATDRAALAQALGTEGALLKPTATSEGAAARSGLGVLPVRLPEDPVDERFDRVEPPQRAPGLSLTLGAIDSRAGVD